MTMKFDMVYTFHFDEAAKQSALLRLNKSINSVDLNFFNIILINCSSYCIKDQINPIIKYLHSPREGIYNRSYMVNMCVKNFITEPYFCLSDIDIIYPPTFVNAVQKIIDENDEPVRIVYFNNNMGVGEFTAYDDCKLAYPNCQDHLRSKRGPAQGLGIIHTESFKKISGFDERYFGYGPEDKDFNMRICQINKYIELDDESINTYHLWHNNFTPKNVYSQNMRIYRYILNHIKNNNLTCVNAGSIEIPPMIYHQDNENIIDIIF